jgi:hydrogenase maturation protease
MDSNQDRILVLGIGNLLLGDEGIGIHAIRALEKEELPDEVDLLDGGTAGFALLNNISGYPYIILIDASFDSFSAGTVRHIKPELALDIPPTLSTHDIGLKDLISSMALLETLPEIDLIAISIKEISDLSTCLSPVIEQSIPAVVSKVQELIHCHLSKR